MNDDDERMKQWDETVKKKLYVYLCNISTVMHIYIYATTCKNVHGKILCIVKISLQVLAHLY